ncbi:MAG TPA: hypothetical protein VG188_02300 [Solirubrobacteraceae bacterium]|nr:hypothetical protein [Solirubrobacteraceae bacterium]
MSKLRVTDRERLLCLSLTVLALLVALVIAASAQADEAASGTTPAAAESQETATSQGSPGSTPPGVESQAPAEGASAEATLAEPEGSGTTPTAPTEESPVVAPGEPRGEVAPEEQRSAPGPEETTSGVVTPEGQGPPIEVTPVGPTPVEQAPVEPTPVVIEEAVVTTPVEVTKELQQIGPIETPEESLGKGPLGEHAEGAVEATPTTSLRSSSPLDTPMAQLDTGRAASAEAPAASGAGLPVIATIAGTELEGPPPGGGPTAPAHAGMTPVERAGDFSCELSQLSGQMTDNCTVGWLGASRLTAAGMPSGLITVASSLVAATIAGTPSEGGHGGVAFSGPPIGPAPSSPSPGGAAGAATGGSGVAPLSTFLTLAGLLLLGAPRVLRRLRLSCEPWLAGCFVLVPERPD